MRFSIQTLALCAILTSFGEATAQTITSTFDADTEAWEVRGFSYSSHQASLGCVTVPSYDALEGLPAGSIRVTDVCSEVAVSAPAVFLGDKSAYLGGELSFDILIRYTDGVDYPAALLRSATKTLFYVMPTTTVGIWESRVVPLTAPGWTVNSYVGPPATTSDLLEVLSELENLLLVTEWNTGADDTNVDNVELRPPTRGAVAYGRGCALTSGSEPGLWIDGLVSSGSTVRVQVDGGVPLGLAFLGIGLTPTSLPLGGGCDLLIMPLAELITLPLLSATGALDMPVTLPPGLTPGPFVPLQAAVFDPAMPLSVAVTNGVQLTLL